jgi:hypothetical protein
MGKAASENISNEDVDRSLAVREELTVKGDELHNATDPPECPTLSLLCFEQALSGQLASQSREHSLRGAHLQAKVAFHREKAHDAVVQDGRVALGTSAKAARARVSLQSNRASKISVPVRDHDDIIAGVLRAPPGSHDEGVIDGDTRDRLHPFGLELFGSQDKAWQVIVRTRRSERARHGEENDLSLSEQLSAANFAGPVSAHDPKLDVGDVLAY